MNLIKTDTFSVEIPEISDTDAKDEAAPVPTIPFVIPADGKESLSIGGHAFDFLPDTSADIPAGFDTGSDDALKGRPEDFMVLLRVSSDSNPGFCFWDAGEIYFVIHKSDLARGDFSNVYCGLESS